MNFSETDLFIVTGASSGIGHAVAKSFLDKGARVITVGRNITRLKDLFGDYIKDERILFEEKDLSVEPSSLVSWMGYLAKAYGKIRGLVLCAGAQQTVPIKALNYESSVRLFNLNYFSVIQMIRGFSSKLVSRDSDLSVTVVSSIASKRPSKGLTTYAATKASINISIQTMALELAPRIRINAVLPGFIDTNMIKVWQGENYYKFKSEIDLKYPLGMGRPEDIANVCLFLASDSSRWITGQEIIVDGGGSLV